MIPFDFIFSVVIPENVHDSSSFIIMFLFKLSNLHKEMSAPVSMRNVRFSSLLILNDM